MGCGRGGKEGGRGGEGERERSGEGDGRCLDRTCALEDSGANARNGRM